MADRTITYDPATHVLAPKEPTDDMAFATTHVNNSLDREGVLDMLRAAIAAAPEPAQAVGQQGGEYTTVQDEHGNWDWKRNAPATPPIVQQGEASAACRSTSAQSGEQTALTSTSGAKGLVQQGLPPDERDAFEDAWPEISKHGINNGWRGVAMAAWQAALAQITSLAGDELPEYARTRKGQKCYSLGYSRGRKRGQNEVKANFELRNNRATPITASDDGEKRARDLLADVLSDAAVSELAKGLTMHIRALLNQPAAKAAPQPQQGSGELQRMTTDDSREYLVKFMERHFTDKTFHRYIRGERNAINLAGDFAWQMATALRQLAATPAPAVDAQGVRDAALADAADVVAQLVIVPSYAKKAAAAAICALKTAKGASNG